jgi:hypothetical protein
MPLRSPPVLAHSYGTPFGVRVLSGFVPGVFAALRPPATLCDPFGINGHAISSTFWAIAFHRGMNISSRFNTELQTTVHAARSVTSIASLEAANFAA